MKPFYITTPIFYASGKPHIGHAYTCLIADYMARYVRMTGRGVHYLTGTDEHGQKISQKAAEAKTDEQSFVDARAAEFEELTDTLAISNDVFYRTTSERHKNTATALWGAVDKNGYIYKKAYTGLYCVGCEAFKTEKGLVDGLCPDHKTTPEPYEQENYFFKLSAFEDRLKALYAERPDFVVPSTRFNEMKQIVEQGLEDVSISRSTETLSWGIPVPGDDTQVMYVWFDALSNYLGEAGYGNEGLDEKGLWPADVHLMAKEINRFHSVLWPAMLMAADIEVPMQIAAHGWITAEGQKMSKSVGNVIDPFDLVDRYGVEPVRYFFAAETSLHNDGDFSHRRFEERYNNDLANALGNLLNRAVSMTDRYLDGVIPEVETYAVEPVWTKYRGAMEELKFNEALEAVFSLVDAMNKFIDQSEPWKLGKLEDKTEVSKVLYVLLEALRHAAWMLLPFMPEASMRIFEQIGTSFEAQAGQTMNEASAWGGLVPGHAVKKGDPLFPRIEQEAV